MNENGIKEELIRQIASLRQEIGEIKGKVEAIASDVAELKREVGGLSSFRWKTYGAVAAISFLAGILGAVVTVISYLR